MTQNLKDAIKKPTTALTTTQGQAPEKKANTAIDVAILKMVEGSEKIKMALPKHIDLNRFIRIMTTYLRGKPELKKCKPESLIACILLSSQLGLELGFMGMADIIPYGDEAKFQIGWRGYLELALRTQKFTKITAAVRRANDYFKYVMGFDEKLIHKFPEKGERGKIIGCYAYAITTLGEKTAEYMSLDEILAIRNRYSKMWKNKQDISNPWHEDNPSFEEMCKKTVIKRLVKRLPISAEFMQQTQLDGVVRKSIREDMITPEANEIDTPDNDIEAFDAIPVTEVSDIPEGDEGDPVQQALFDEEKD